MATIHIKLARPTDTGTTPCDGTIRLTPIRRYVTDHTVIVPDPFTVDLTNGEATITIPDSDTTICWAITELPGTPQEHTRYVQIPSNTTDTVEYTDLIDVNPSTFLPVAVAAGPLLQIALAADAQAALAYSRTHPETLVLYSEEASINAMAATVADIAAVRSAAQTQANHATGSAQTAAAAAETAAQNLQSIENTAQQIGVVVDAITNAAESSSGSQTTGEPDSTPADATTEDSGEE
ncbi:hypothetical protein LF919_05205 [Bifidobacterium pseudolongum]|uniref:hypothetical protein n=1 Tax=Bifidobacterium pseudolongum TaxID=1694 RepID=UPI001F0D040B|nr:hypothetical protein [Bifidobacterium pseudolongum]MCH4835296.1 hypothetical protein [Bifidobacterium pseudolongum]